mmetsp:Transcript_11774/g.19138  ORF Transcript_11774/g.19138 Transcript_11774/m.19138 type:complete len:374 (-) Transcript_11774:75-1196(-)
MATSAVFAQASSTFSALTPLRPNAVAQQRRDTTATPGPSRLLDTIGNTPLVELTRLNSNPLARVFVKLEFVNPSGSIKDRIAKHIIETFEREGRLKPGWTIVENSSGNTAAAVAMVAALKGYKSVLVVPHKCSIEKQNALKAFGARVIVSPPGAQHGTPEHYESIAIRLASELPNAVRLDQYNNPLNIEAHYWGTGREIWEQTRGDIDYFVCGGSTGGTITGVSRFLKERSDKVKIVLCDPAGSSMANAFRTGSYESSPGASQIEGLGKNYQVDCYDPSLVDDAFSVGDRDAFLTARRMAQEEGILCGISSGANVWSALELARRATVPTNIVTVLPDGGSKYLSKLFNPQWLLDHQIISPEEFAEMTAPDPLC